MRLRAGVPRRFGRSREACEPAPIGPPSTRPTSSAMVAETRSAIRCGPRTIKEVDASPNERGVSAGRLTARALGIGVLWCSFPEVSGAMTKKEPEVVRRVWRMTADAPAGEYLDLELVPKETPTKSGIEGTPRRTFHPETPPAYRKLAVAIDAPTQAPESSTAASTNGPTESVARPTARREQASADLPLPAAARARVLRPAQVESWQESSFDLATGCVVRDVTDTIPGKIYEELFGPGNEHLSSPIPRRRR